MENKKMLEGFYQLVGDLGYNNFGIEKLAQISGIDEELIYEEYENKEQLLLEVMKYIYLKEKVLIFKLDYSKDLKEELIEKGLMFIKLNRYDKHYSAFKNQILLISLTNEAIKDVFSEIIEQYINLFKQIVVDLNKKYFFKEKENIQELAYEIYLLLDSLILYENYKNDINSEKIWKDFIDRLFYELK